MTAALAQRSDDTEADAPSANRPAATIRVGSVTASVWRNQNDKGTFFSVTYKKSYKDSEAKWHDTDNFSGVGDNLELHKAADMAATRIIELQAQGRSR